MRYNVNEKSGQIKSFDYQIEIKKKILLETIKTLLSNIQTRKTELENIIIEYRKSLIKNTNQQNAIELSRLERINLINEEYYNKLIDTKTSYTIAKAGYVSENIILQK